AQPQQRARSGHQQDDTEPSERQGGTREALQHDRSYRRVHGIDRERDRHLPEYRVQLQSTVLSAAFVATRACQSEKPPHFPSLTGKNAQSATVYPESEIGRRN